MKKSAFLLALFNVVLSTPLMTDSTPKVKFLDEYIIQQELKFQNTTVGGLSSIDYADGYFYLISDHGGGKRSNILGEPRYYKADIKIANDKIENVEFLSTVNLIPKGVSTNGVDPESLRVINQTGQYIWSCEGSAKHGIAPAVYISELAQQPNQLTSKLSLPNHFKINKNTGPRNNAVFEGISLSNDGKGAWVGMEGPLKQDAQEPTLTQGALVRLSYFNLSTGLIERQFAYNLDALPNEPKAKPDAFRTTGLVEVLQLADNRFLLMERAYTSGLEDGGNRVKLYLVDASAATDTKAFDSLKDKPIIPAKKQLLLDLASVEKQFGSKRVDNIEGITFGPKLASGNASLLLVSDDNFNTFGDQISQILLFELIGLK